MNQSDYRITIKMIILVAVSMLVSQVTSPGTYYSGHTVVENEEGAGKEEKTLIGCPDWCASNQCHLVA